jgi:hypothetical protein
MCSMNTVLNLNLLFDRLRYVNVILQRMTALFFIFP